MANTYSDELTNLLKRTYPELATTHTLEFKSFFGAVAGYIDGIIFVSCGNFGVALRLPAQLRDELFAMEDVEHLKYFPNGHVKKEYAVLPKRILEDEELFRKLVEESIGYVSKPS